MLALLAALCLQDVQDLVDRCFAEPDKAARAAILRELEKFPIREVEAAVRKGATGKPAEGGKVIVRDSNTEHGGRAFRYHVLLPAGYDPAKRYRMILTLHGTKGSGENQLNLWAAEARGRDDLIVVSPTIEGDAWGGTRRGHSHVITPVKEMLRDFSVDPDQVWLGGVSMGGTGAFRVAGYLPDRFAGIIPRVQGPRFDGDAVPGRKEPVNVRPRFLENFRNVPVYWIVGKQDTLVPIEWMRQGHEKLKSLGCAVVFREMDGGHDAYVSENPAILDWMKGKARNPYPDEVVYHSAEKDYARAYWVEIDRHSKGPTRKYAYQDFSGKILEHRAEFVEEAQVRARLKRGENAIEAEVKNADQVTFRLSDAMLDLDKPVVIRVNGKEVHNRKVSRSLKLMMEDAYERMDRGMTFTASVRVRP